jgi:hypothetical protein
MGVIDYKVRPRIKRKPTLAVETEKTVKALVVTLGILIFVLAVSFMAILSQNNQKGYSLEQVKLKNESLKNENADLSTKITEATTFHSLETADKTKDMSQTDAKTFVTEEDNAVKN